MKVFIKVSSLMMGALLLGSLSPQAWALNVGHLTGEKTTTFHSPRGVEEKCVVPKKWSAGLFTEDDLKKESKLCQMDFYSNMGVCPKFNSTNPGVLLITPNDRYSASAITKSRCDLDDMNVKTAAKFKQSISCSYTPSILAYYQVSRLLGGAGRVPVAVIRTMDMRTHKDISDKASSYLRGSKSLIAQTWASFDKVHRRPGDYAKIVDDSHSQIYGALVQNVKGENIYTEVNGVGSYDTRYPRFLRQRPFLNVTSSSSAAQIAGGTQFNRIAPLVVQMKDVSDMVLMDTLLNQQDRIGNIHYKFVWYSVAGNEIAVDKSDARISKKQLVIPAHEKEEMAEKNAVLVREMYLKDNDCGVAKDNNMRLHSALEKVRHMSYVTYSRFMKLSKSIDLADTRSYFMRELLFSSNDFAELSQNVKKAKDILLENCRKSVLRFDIDVEDYVPGAAVKTKSCEI